LPSEEPATAAVPRWLAGSLALALAFTAAALASPLDTATAAPAPAFDCAEPRFFAQAEQPLGTGQLFQGRYTAAGGSQWDELGGTVADPTLYNALAFNPTDEYLYATVYRPSGGTGTAGSFVRIDRDGIPVNVGPSVAALGNPPSTLWDAGEFGPDGTYYVASGNAGTQKIYKITGLDGAPTVKPIRTEIPLSAPIRFADLAFKDGYLWAHSYGVDNQFHRIGLNGAVTSISSAAIPTSNYGSAFAMTNGNLAFVGTNNLMYQVAVTGSTTATPSFDLVSTVAAPTNQRSDATNCSTAKHANLSVAKTGPATVIMGEQVEWTITVTNNGPGVSSGFVALDTLPAGVTGAVATSEHSSCGPKDGLIVCNGGRLAVDQSAVIKLTATAPMTVGTIVNTVRVVGNESSSPTTSAPAKTEVTLGTTAGGSDTAELDLGPAGVDAAVTNGAHGTVVNEGGNLVYTPADDFSGVDEFTYTDGAGTTIAVFVTVVPQALPDAVSTSVNSAVSGTVRLNDSGVNLQFSKSGNPANGVAVVNLDGTFTYTPNPAFLGTDSFRYAVTGAGGTAASTVTVTVVTAPVAGTDRLSTPANTVIDDIAVLANDSGDALTAVLLAAPANGTAVDNGDNTFTYTPGVDFSGSDQFTYRLLSGNGGSATGTVTVTVTPVAHDDSIRTVAGTDGVLDVRTNDAGANLTATLLAAPGDGRVTVSAGGIMTYTPNAGYSGPDSFRYSLAGDGGTSTATVAVSVAPVASGDAATTPSGRVVSIDVLANDAGSALSVTQVSAPASGIATAGVAGVTYAPNAGFSGLDTFRYTARDASGNTVTASVTVTVTPVAVNDAVSTPASMPLTFRAATNDVGSSLRVTATTAGAHGVTAINSNGSVTYTPDAAFSGFDSFGYTVTDAAGLTTTASVRVTVSPTVLPDSVTTVAGGTRIIHLLGNDVGRGLKVTSVTQPTGGTLVLNPDGTVTYTARAGFSGADTFDYVVTDSAGQSVSSTVTISVDPPVVVNPPVALDPPATGMEPPTPASLRTSVTLPATGGQFGGLLQPAVALMLIGATMLAGQPRPANRHCA
jgi:uncharacterized repeat protein (TIGR01451 family)